MVKRHGTTHGFWEVMPLMPLKSLTPVDGRDDKEDDKRIADGRDLILYGEKLREFVRVSKRRTYTSCRHADVTYNHKHAHAPHGRRP